MRKQLLLIVILAIIFTGCFQRHPIAYMYEDWQKKDGYPYFRTEAQKKLDEIEAQKALLECGHESPLGDSRNDSNLAAIMGRCMEKSGFINKWYLDYTGGKTYCDRHPSLPACNLPLTQIPDRNISMRLNSKWCTKKFPQADACKP